MLVEVIKNHYVIVLAETPKDQRWLKQSGYSPLGEDYYQLLFENQKELLEEIDYLLDVNAEFEDRDDSEDPASFLDNLKSEGLIK